MKTSLFHYNATPRQKGTWPEAPAGGSVTHSLGETASNFHASGPDNARESPATPFAYGDMIEALWQKKKALDKPAAQPPPATPAIEKMEARFLYD